jgi:hypothetical protein
MSRTDLNGNYKCKNNNKIVAKDNLIEIIIVNNIISISSINNNIKTELIPN